MEKKDLDMIQIWNMVSKEFKITMIPMLKNKGKDGQNE